MATRLPDHQAPYWDRVAHQKRFTHPVRWDWLRAHGAPPARASAPRFLDLGCGYGRLLEELEAEGRKAVGLDASAAMLRRARSERPSARLVQAAGRLPFRDASLEGVLLVSVLTCNPDPDARLALLAEVERVLVPGGLLFVSDLLTQTDARNRARYAAGHERFAQESVFALDEGVVLVHLPEAELRQLFAPFHALEDQRTDVVTMNGHPSRAFQMLLEKRA